MGDNEDYDSRRSLILGEHGDDFCSYDDDDLQAAARLRRKRQRIRACLWMSLGIFIVALVGVGVFFATNSGTSSSSKAGQSGPPMGRYSRAAVASDVTQCSQIGRDILEKSGGNAVDAAVATLLCMGLADPQSMGIGGGFFMTIYNRSTGESYSIDARETAPGLATEDMFYTNASSSKGGLSIAVPGSIKGHHVAMERFGSLPWKQVFEPSIAMATQGFPVPHSLESALEDFLSLHGDISVEEVTKKFPQFAKTFINPTTKDIYREGETIRMPELGTTYKVIAEEGYQAFYNGSLTPDILQECKDAGAIITAEDLKSYEPLLQSTFNYTLSDGTTILTPQTPSSGVILMFILGILDGYKLTPADISTTPGEILTYHRVIEAFKFAYAKRTNLADARFVSNVTELVANLTSKAYIDSIRAQIWDNQTHPFMYYGPTYYSENKTSTAHLSVVDQWGNAVAVTSTINARFGSEVFGNRTGIIWNDEMDDFATSDKPNDFGIPPSPANKIEPGKRPLSSMCPSVFVDGWGEVKMVVGAAGGSRITTATAWVALRSLWLGDSIKEAIDSQRFHHQLLPPFFTYETGVDKAVIDGLKALGHNATEVSSGISIVQGIVRDEAGVLLAYSDARKGGSPAGF